MTDPMTRLAAADHPFSAALVEAALGEAELTAESLDAIETWEYWPTLAIRYFFPGVLGPPRSDPEYATLVERIDRSWGLE